MMTARAWLWALAYLGCLTGPAASETLADLKRGLFVLSTTPCGEASSTTALTFDGARLYGGRTCFIPRDAAGGLTMATCPVGTDAPQAVANHGFSIKSTNEITGTAGLFRYCDPVALPPMWRTAGQRSTPHAVWRGTSPLGTFKAHDATLTIAKSDAEYQVTIACPGCAGMMGGDYKGALKDNAIMAPTPSGLVIYEPQSDTVSYAGLQFRRIGP